MLLAQNVMSLVIDNQLMVTGRQGDPGSSRFFVSLEDEIMRLFGGEQISKLMEFLKIDEAQPIEHAMIGKAIEQAQVKVEGFFFDQRKRLVEFDDVMNQQREIIYSLRRKVLFGERNVKEDILQYIDESIQSIVSLHAPEENTLTDEDAGAIVNEFVSIIPFDEASQHHMKKTFVETHSSQELETKLLHIAHDVYSQREKTFSDTTSREIERYVTLSSIDQQWMDKS